MTGPERIWILPTHGAREPDDYFLLHPDYRNGRGSEYIRRDPATLAELPEVQALIAANYRRLVAEITGNPSGTKCDACRACGHYHCADAFYGCPGMRDYTLEEATAALARMKGFTSQAIDVWSREPFLLGVCSRFGQARSVRTGPANQRALRTLPNYLGPTATSNRPPHSRSADRSRPQYTSIS